MNIDKKARLEEITKASQAELKHYYGRIKMVPLIIVYQIWVVGTYSAFGWFSAVPAAAVTAFGLSDGQKDFGRILPCFYF